MRVAVVADIHGNVWALDAVLERLESLDVDHVLNLGDCFWGPLAPAATFDRLKDRDWLTIRGNQDRVVLDPGEGRTDHFTVEELGDEGVRWIAARTSPTVRLGSVFACHGTPDRDDVTLIECVETTHVRWADGNELNHALAGLEPGIEVVLCGHSHRPAILELEGRLIVNPGSVGLPAYEDDSPHPHRMESGSPHARWAIIDRSAIGWNVELAATPYDVEAAAAAARRNGRDDWARWITTGRA
jgi:predicted phosphodiesterase